MTLGWVLYDSGKYDAAEEAASRTIGLFLDQGKQFDLCQCHRLLAKIYEADHRREKAIVHSQAALNIATRFDWHHELSWNHHNLAWLFLKEARFADAQSHIQWAKSHAIDDQYTLACAAYLQAALWSMQRKYGEAKSETLRAIEIYKKIGAVRDVEMCRRFIQENDSESDV